LQETDAKDSWPLCAILAHLLYGGYWPASAGLLMTDRKFRGGHVRNTPIAGFQHSWRRVSGTERSKTRRITSG
jgi:hypothetical protein